MMRKGRAYAIRVRQSVVRVTVTLVGDDFLVVRSSSGLNFSVPAKTEPVTAWFPLDAGVLASECVSCGGPGGQADMVLTISSDGENRIQHKACVREELRREFAVPLEGQA